MKEHERAIIVREAERALRNAVGETTRGLTDSEIASVLVRVMADEVAGIMKYRIRQERHGNTDTPGDVQ